MPNWIEGTMRIRGPISNIIHFLEESIQKYEYEIIDGKPTLAKVKNENAPFIDIYRSDECVEINVCNGKDAHIEGTLRCFLTDDIYAYFELDKDDPDKDYVLCADVKQAWGFKENNFGNLSKKYNLDFRLLGWEMGMEYEGEVLALRGLEPRYYERKFDDWLWEAPCPLLGG